MSLLLKTREEKRVDLLNGLVDIFAQAKRNEEKLAQLRAIIDGE